MNIGAIIAATVLVAAVGLFIGVFLGVAGKKFAVEVDEKEVAVREALPGNNCGGCGYPGCDGLAAAIAKGEAPVNVFPAVSYITLLFLRFLLVSSSLSC